MKELTINHSEVVKIKLTSMMNNKLFWPLFALALLLLFNLVNDPSFFHIEIKNGRLFGSIIDILNRAAPIALLALGMTLVIATGGIDLSVGAVVAISGAVCAYLIQNDIITSTPIIIIAGISVALIAGLWNGVLVSLLGIQPIIATLILMVAGRGIAQLITGGQILTFNHEGFEFIGGGNLFGLPFSIILVIITYSLTFLVLKKTALGLFISSIGANPTASYFAGIREPQIKVLVYVFSGLCAGLAGMILTSDIQGADANNAGLWSELDAILAVVVGGTALAGGRYYIGPTLVGVLILQTMTTTILTSGLPVQFTHIVKAGVVILVMLIMSPQFRKELNGFGKLYQKEAGK
ncbi:ABC transporter permease [Agarivorans sp. MS3-6]|uniref:ABC transporter permease n=1 Tax=Agarivorans sp. TSD2052 TaxID=2937286 RepID=UPI00200D6DE5|nr:ABC transporter permease [Agarivorans sp. TSD2052]UPW20132.1 ABC transporter permease [Agarivorans sp. TSD2052]